MAATSLRAIARARGIKLALLPGECRDEDLRLIECSTLPRAELDALLGYFREGGPANMRALVRRLAGLAGREAAGRGGRSRCRRPGSTILEGTSAVAMLACPLERGDAHACTRAAEPCGRRRARPGGTSKGAPVIPILFYRSMLLAADVAPIDALCEALRAKGMRPCRSSSPA